MQIMCGKLRSRLERPPMRAALACASVMLAFGAQISISAVAPANSQTVVADPVSMLSTATRHDIVGANVLAIETTPRGRFLRSTPNRSASGLYQRVTLSVEAMSEISWTWRVDQLQRSADIRTQTRDDFGAMIAFVFGEPTWWNRDVPTIAYVWTSTPIANGMVVQSNRLKQLHYVQLRGRPDVGVMHREARNIVSDFMSAFGRPPPELRYIAVFNDNDQTGEPTSAVFGPIVSAH